MRSPILLSALTIALAFSGSIVSTIGFPEVIIAQSVADQNEEADQMLKNGRQYVKNSKYQLALEYLKKSLSIYRNTKNVPGEIESTYLIGVTYSVLGKSQQSINSYQINLSICLKINNQYCKARVLDSIGFEYLNLGLYQEAITYFKEVLIALPSLVRYESNCELNLV